MIVLMSLIACTHLSKRMLHCCSVEAIIKFTSNEMLTDHWIVKMGHKRMAVAGKMSDTFSEAYRSLPQ